MKEKMFDVIIANPPYNNCTGDSFLLKFLDLATQVVTIQPYAWIVNKNRKKLHEKVEQTECHIDTVNGIEYFDAKFFNNIAVQNFRYGGKNIFYNNVKYEHCIDVKYFTNEHELVKFYNKIKDVKDNLIDHVKGNFTSARKYYEPNPNNDWICFRIAKIRTGHFGTKCYYTIFPADKKYIDRDSGTYKELMARPNDNGNTNFLYFIFNSDYERDNFINYLKTDFARGALILGKRGINTLRGNFDYIPWQDFGNEIFSKTPKEIDDYLFNKYEIEPETRQYLENKLADFYGIRD